MKRKGKVGKVFAVFSTVALIANINLTCFADALSDAQKQVNDLKNQIDANKSAISSVETEVNGYLNEINNLDTEIATYTEKLNTLQSQVDSINQQVQNYQNELQNSAQLYNSAEDIYNTRLRAIYENGIPSVFEILVSSDGIGDFFSKLNVYTSILEYDQSLIGNMKNQKEYVDYLKTNIEEGKLSVEQLSYDVEKSANELEGVKSQKEEKMNQLNSSKVKLLAANKILLEEKEKADNALAEEIRKSAAQNGQHKGYFSNVFVWPTVSSTITCGFGGYVGHYGVDIGVSRGTQVWSAAAGTVAVATTVTSDPNGPYTANGAKDHSYSARNGYGYGNYVVVDNGLDSQGRRIYTYYGHLSSVAVSVGQGVAQGQVIGYSGNTGNSYGAHLHFEVRVNGTAVNPMSYFN